MAVTRDVLALRALGLGDLLTAVPALRGLRRVYPGRHIDLAAPAALAPVVRLIGAVDGMRPTSTPTDVGPGPRPAIAVNLHGKGPQSTTSLAALLPHRLITHGHPDLDSVTGPPWHADQHEVRRWCDLLKTAGIDADPTDLDLPRPGEPASAGAVVIHPGAGYPARRWPPGRFAAVARDLAEGGLPVVVTGSRAETGLAREVAALAGLPDTAVLAGRTTLAQLCAVVAHARLVLCGDTGVGHLATAFGTPSVLLFGPTPPKLWGPPEERPQHVALWVGDLGDPHGDRPDPGLLLLSEERVLSTVRDSLDGKHCHA